MVPERKKKQEVRRHNLDSTEACMAAPRLLIILLSTIQRDGLGCLLASHRECSLQRVASLYSRQLKHGRRRHILHSFIHSASRQTNECGGLLQF